MILRPDPDGVIAITQPAHAMCAGQLAEAWGNAEFPDFAPRREVCIAAGLHDLGWLAWEATPTWNPQTGWPHAFDELPSEIHAEIWSRGPQQALVLGRYVALLVSLHGTGLFEGHSPYGDPSATQQFLADQKNYQQELIRNLQADRYFTRYAAPEQVEYNRNLVRVTDALSLYACLGLDRERKIPDVPTAKRAVTMRMIPTDKEMTRIRLNPWPFKNNFIQIALEGRHLSQKFDSEPAMRLALASAPWVRIPIHFIPI